MRDVVTNFIRVVYFTIERITFELLNPIHCLLHGFIHFRGVNFISLHKISLPIRIHFVIPAIAVIEKVRYSIEVIGLHLQRVELGVYNELTVYIATRTARQPFVSIKLREGLPH